MIFLEPSRMTSVLRYTSQRNTNSTQIVPVYGGILPQGGPFDLSGSAYYTLNLSKVQYSGGSFYVDLSDKDASGNPLDFSGRFLSGGNSIAVVNFVVTVDIPASYATNMEFTIFFKNIPYSSIGAPLTIGLLAPEALLGDAPPYPYILSAPAPPLIAPFIFPSLTMKSDGTNYTVVSSGPAGWMGIYLLAILVSSLGVF